MTMGDRFDQDDLVSRDMTIPSQRQHPDSDREHPRGSDLAALMASGEIIELELATDPGMPWTVRCCSKRYAILTRTVGMGQATHDLYTVIDWRNGLAGPCTLTGGRWRDGTYDPADCQLLLAVLTGGVIAVNRALATPLLISHTTSRSHP